MKQPPSTKPLRILKIYVTPKAKEFNIVCICIPLSKNTVKVLVEGGTLEGAGLEIDAMI